MPTGLAVRAFEILRDDGPASLARSTKSFTSQLSKDVERRVENRLNKMRYGDSYPSWNRLVRADPEAVQHYLLESEKTDWNFREYVEDELSDLYDLDKAGFMRRRNAGRILGGDWDAKKRAWENHELYRSLRQVYREDRPWEETEFFDRCLARLEGGYDSYGYETKDEFLSGRIPYIESLYESMSENGYLTQDDAPDDHRNEDVLHEVSVNVGRDGELIFNNTSGQHRLSLAKLLGIREIPMVVIVRHERWQDVRHEISTAETIAELSPRAREHLSHPDVQDVVSNELAAERSG